MKSLRVEILCSSDEVKKKVLKQIVPTLQQEFINESETVFGDVFEGISQAIHDLAINSSDSVNSTE